jgi:hypothetical protein
MEHETSLAWPFENYQQDIHEITILTPRTSFKEEGMTHCSSYVTAYVCKNITFLKIVM